MDQIFIKDLSVYGVIGIHDWERQKPREILVNLVIFTDLHKSGNSDNIADTIDYGMVATKVRMLVESNERLTVEALATDIAHLCLEIPGVQSVRVRVDKPGAVMYSQAVGVEIERSKEDLSFTESD